MARSRLEQAIERYGILLILLLAVVVVAFVVFTVLTFILVALTSLVAGTIRLLRRRTYKHRRTPRSGP
jgi:Flp pilus assembly protein TadB